jgi:dihydrofolate synthase/folylpolyglutamate synthase
MNYEQTCEYLFQQTANYENQGKSGYKPGLDNMQKLDEHYGRPHQSFRSIHIAGTNGKGSVSHTIAAILQVCGYRVGLYTSPHLTDFSDRIRVNGKPIEHDYVTHFVESGKKYFEQNQFTFFEITTEMAFNYFKEKDIDIAVIEVGLGGRLDSTNIINPILSVITNVSLDHTQILGSSIEQIAMEKGGIIKNAVPVIIGEADENTRPIFETLAQKCNAPIAFAQDDDKLISAEYLPETECIYYTHKSLGNFKGQLCGIYQEKNTRTILAAITQLVSQGYLIYPTMPETKASIYREMSHAFFHVCDITGLQGRWQKVRTNPTVICDIGHNPAAWRMLSQQIDAVKANHKHIIFGMVGDKDVYGVMSMLPKDATYYFTKASSPRMLPEQSIQVFGQQLGLRGKCYPTVADACKSALEVAENDDFIFVGGSNYIVSDFLRVWD